MIGRLTGGDRSGDGAGEDDDDELDLDNVCCLVV